MSVPCTFLISHTESYRRHQTQMHRHPWQEERKEERDLPPLFSPIFFFFFALSLFLLSCSEVKTFHYVATSMRWLMAGRKETPPPPDALTVYIDLPLSLRCWLTSMASRDLPFPSPLSVGSGRLLLLWQWCISCHVRNGEVVGVSWRRTRACCWPQSRTRLQTISWIGGWM